MIFLPTTWIQVRCVPWQMERDAEIRLKYRRLASLSAQPSIMSLMRFTSYLVWVRTRISATTTSKTHSGSTILLTTSGNLNRRSQGTMQTVKLAIIFVLLGLASTVMTTRERRNPQMELGPAIEYLERNPVRDLLINLFTITWKRYKHQSTH